MSTRILLDASVYVPFILKAGRRLVYELVATARASLLTLTPYEACNAFWKLARLRGDISPGKAAYLCGVSWRLAEKMPKLSPTPGDAVLIQDTAIQEGLTFYDAAYLHTAMAYGLVLYTRDQRLAKAAREKGVMVEDGRELIGGER